MSKLISAIAVIAIFGGAIHAQAPVCEDLVTQRNALVSMQKLSERYVVLSRRTWQRTPVIRGFGWQDCSGSLRETIYKYEGRRYRTLATYDDPCDGGNVYGVLLDGRGRVVAHIYDSDLYCPSLWREDQ